MIRSALLASLIACSTAAAVGCATNAELHRVRMPEKGVELAYDLTPGVAYEGRLRLGNLQQLEGSEPRQRSLEADLRLSVVGVEPEGTVIMRALFRNVELEWDLPSTTTMTADQFTRLAGAQLEGMELSFNLSTKGQVVFMPEPPPQVTPEVAEVIVEITDALESMFVVVPGRALRRGETWVQPLEIQTTGRTRRGQTQAKLTGLYRHQDHGAQVARVELQRELTELTTDGVDERRIDRQSNAIVLFSVDGFVAELDGETRELDPVDGLRLRKLQVELVKRKAAAGSNAATEIQAVADPCDPDYVGPEACETEAPDSPPASSPSPAPTGKGSAEDGDSADGNDEDVPEQPPAPLEGDAEGTDKETSDAAASGRSPG